MRIRCHLHYLLSPFLSQRAAENSGPARTHFGMPVPRTERDFREEKEKKKRGVLTSSRVQPAVDDPELEELIDQRTNLLIKSIEASVSAGSKSHRGQIAVEFYERRPKKAWFSKAEEKVCWEQWLLSVTLVNPRTDSGMLESFAHAGW